MQASFTVLVSMYVNTIQYFFQERYVFFLILFVVHLLAQFINIFSDRLVNIRRREFCTSKLELNII